MSEKEFLESIKNNPNCLEVIAGGIGQDDDIGDFWDYVYTLNKMKEILEKNGLKPPFIIKSNRIIKVECNRGNHVKPIAKEIAIQTEDKESVYFEIPSLYVLRDNVYVSEFDYIMSRDWVKDWIVEELINEEYYYLKLEKDGKYVFAGNYYTLTIYGS